LRIAELVKQYNYKPLPAELSAAQRAQYLKELPSNLQVDGDQNCELYSRGLKISNGYRRIVIGDYGAYIEIAPSQMEIENLEVTPGMEYRLNKNYISVKYIWLCPKGQPDVKIYFQQHPVSYADYQPMMFYISPFEVAIKQKEKEE